MRMSYEGLLGEGRLQRIAHGADSVSRQMALAHRDLQAARRNLASDPDWAFAIAYNAVLQAGRALLTARGYRPIGSDQHVTAIECLRIEPLDAGLARRAERMRRRRHRVVYETVGAVSGADAEAAIATAQQIVAAVAELVEKDG